MPESPMKIEVEIDVQRQVQEEVFQAMHFDVEEVVYKAVQDWLDKNYWRLNIFRKE